MHVKDAARKFLMKWLPKSLRDNLNVFGKIKKCKKKKKKKKTSSALIDKQIRKLDKHGKDHMITSFYKVKFLILQDLWGVYYQILSII